MLAKVTLPDKTTVTFNYDALGRRIEKRYKKTITKWLWDSNKPLHEWKEFDFKETTPDDLITWIFEEDSFAPAAKIKGDKKYSLVCDHLGTPTQGYNEEGALIWERQLDSYGKTHFQNSNEALYNKMQRSSKFAKSMESKYPGVTQHVQPGPNGKFARTSPPGLTWHHSNTPGKMQLVDHADHSKYHKIYHPDGSGGKKKWGGGRQRKKKAVGYK